MHIYQKLTVHMHAIGGWGLVQCISDYSHTNNNVYFEGISKC